MDQAEQGSNPGGTTVETGIDEYMDSVESGNYRSNAKSVLEDWQTWTNQNRGKNRLDELDALDLRRYARHLKTKVREGELAASTAHTYYSYVRAFLTFCVDDGFITGNPAKDRAAVDELPEDDGNRKQQFWSREDREQILDYVDDKAHTAIESSSLDDPEVLQAFRDRALVYVLALSGVRGGEVCRDYEDYKRTGVTWRDLDLEEGTARVFGKSREYEHAQLPSQTCTVLNRYRRVLKPPTPRFPVFPSGHYPTRRDAVATYLEEEEGWDEKRIGDVVDERGVDSLIEEFEVVVPAITTHGARSVMKRLCEEAGISVEDGYLKPHGARRGLGDLLYREHPELAQSALRHSSISTTHKNYSDIQASETSSRVDDVLERED